MSRTVFQADFLVGFQAEPSGQPEFAQVTLAIMASVSQGVNRMRLGNVSLREV